MNIGQAAAACGLPSKTIRYYEDIGLVIPARQQGNDYRVYSLSDIDHLRFLQRSRAVGFSLDECRELLSLYTSPERRCMQVKPLVVEKIAQVDQQLIALNAIRQTLMQMANECTGDDSRDCAIINTLAAAPHTHTNPLPMSFTLVENSHE